jgi:hypothetical protein
LRHLRGRAERWRGIDRVLEIRTLTARGQDLFPQDDDVLKQARIVQKQRVLLQHFDRYFDEIADSFSHELTLGFFRDLVHEFRTHGDGHNPMDL